MVRRGTTNRTRTQFETDLANIGADLSVDSSREVTTLKVIVPKEKQNEAVNLLTDAVANALLDKNQVEAERESVYRHIINVQQDQHETVLENVHYTVPALRGAAVANVMSSHTEII